MSAGLAPTLGPQVAHFINRFGVHGPGDKMGERFELSFEELAFLYQAYELTKDPYRPGVWRRRYRHGIYCRRKGLRKSELMGEVTLAEFDGPVRFSGVWAEGGEVDEWGHVFEAGEPIGQRVRSPEIPVVATTEEQAEKLVWGVIRYVFLNTPLASRYSVLSDEIGFAGQPKEAGRCYLVPPTNSDAADGAKPTFIPREEAHLWTSADLRRTADVMDRNAIKRQAADPWTMDATTIHAPGERSVLEVSIKAKANGDSSILFDHLAASEDWDLDDDDQWLEAVREASGDAWEWTNVAGMRSLFLNPEKSRAEFCRYQLNQGKAIEAKPYDGAKWDLFADPSRTPEPSKRVPLVVFLHGSMTADATALICWTVEERPHLFLAGMWARTDASLKEEWHVPKTEVVACVDELERDYLVVALGGDQDRAWGAHLTAWEAEWADAVKGTDARSKLMADRVVSFGTQRGKLVNSALDRWDEEWRVGLAAAAKGEATPWTHDGSLELRTHFSSSLVRKRGGSSPYRMLAKDGSGIDDAIDAAVASVCGFALVPDALAKAAELLKPRSAGIL